MRASAVAALRGGAREGRKLTESLRVSPVHVLDNQQKRLTAGGSVDEPRKRELLAARAGGGVDRLVEPAVLIALRRLDQIAQIQRVVDRRRFGVWRGCQRPVDLAGRGIARQIEEAANEGAEHASSSLDAEVERPAHVAGEAELGAERLQFLDETRLADARLAAHDDDCTRLPVSDRRERAAALGKLGAATDQRAALGRRTLAVPSGGRRERGHRSL